MVALFLVIALVLSIEPVYKAYMASRKKEQELSNAFKQARDEVSKRKRN